MNHMTIDGSDAPWNDYKKEREVEVIVSLTMSKTFRIKTSNYEIDSGKDEDGVPYENIEYTNLLGDIESSVVLPNELGPFITKVIQTNAIKVPERLQSAIKDCDGWTIDEIECIEN